MKTRICFSVFLIALLLVGTIFTCKSDSAKVVTLIAADDGWDSQKFHIALAKLVIEHAYEGYELQVSTASSTMNWQSIINNDIDLNIEMWIDSYPTYHQDVLDGTIINISVLVEDSIQGIYVPRYVVEGDPSRGIAPMAPTLRRVEDLLRYPHVFPDFEDPSRGRLYGSIPGWLADTTLSRKYEYLGLDKSYNYIRLGSEAALFMSLESAYNLGEPWVGYCWEPSWIAGKLDVIILEDAPYEHYAFQEGKTAFPDQELLTVSSREFAAKAPDILEFLKRFRTGSALLSEALAYINDSGASYDATAVWFLKNNDALLDDWLPAENAGRLRHYISQR